MPARSEAAGAGRSAGCRSSRRSTESSAWRRTCGCSRGSSGVPDVERAVARMLAQTGLAERAHEQVDACRAATASASTSRSACSAAPRCCCSTSRAPRSTRASASGCGASIGALARAGTAVVYSTHNVSEAERYADRVLVLADGERLFWGRPESCARRSRGRRSGEVRTSRRRSSPSSPAGPLMGARDADALAAVKDLQILRRSPLLVAVLVLYPVVRRAADRLALSRGPERPKVAFVNELPAGRDASDRRRGASTCSARRSELFERVDPIERRTREEAIEKVKRRRGAGARS